MFKLAGIQDMNQKERLRYMLLLTKSQLSSENDDLANISNVTGIIMACIDELNWAGFYFLRDNELVLGPFQGLPACNRIEIGKGVCGTAVKTREVQLVDDVHEFPGHIACDDASNAELVIPIIKDEKLYGVLDLDSPMKNRFTDLEEEYFIKLVDILNENINWKNI
ncbi:MAG: GAF domain-containing protein [Tissierellaceae bacterium]